MRYAEYRDAIQRELTCHPEGRTWAELQDHLALPYMRPCPFWTSRLEEEIGLVREQGSGRALVWKVKPRRK